MGNHASIGTIRLFAAADFLLQKRERAAEDRAREPRDDEHIPDALRKVFTQMELKDASEMLRRMGFQESKAG